MFDDILIEFEQILSRGFMTSTNSSSLHHAQQLLVERIYEDLREYYSEIVSVVQKRYEEVKMILETYFRQ